MRGEVGALRATRRINEIVRVAKRDYLSIKYKLKEQTTDINDTFLSLIFTCLVRACWKNNPTKPLFNKTKSL